VIMYLIYIQYQQGCFGTVKFDGPTETFFVYLSVAGTLFIVIKYPT